MADIQAVRKLRAEVEYRLFRAVEAASKREGIPFELPPIPDYEPELKAARTLECVAVFIEKLNQKSEKKP